MNIWTTEEEAERLRARFEGVNRAKFARENSVPGGGSMIHQHTKAIRPISLECAIAYAKGFRVDLAEISPRLALEVANARLVTPDLSAKVAEPQNALTEHLVALEIAVGALAPILRTAGQDALRKWASKDASASDTAAALEGLAIATRSMSTQKKPNGASGPLGKAA